MLFMEKDENGFQNFSIRILESTESLRQVVLDEFENFIFKELRKLCKMLDSSQWPLET